MSNKNTQSIQGLTIHDFDIPQVFDDEGYHRDIEVNGFEDTGNGMYSMTIHDMGRSDKSVSEILTIQYMN